MFRPLAEKKNIDLRVPARRGDPAAAAGPGQAAADPLQPAVQRDQVHARGRPGHAAGRGRGAARRPRRWPTPGVGIAEEDRRLIFEKFRQAGDRPGRRRPDPRARGHRPGPVDRPRAVEAAGRRRHLESELGRGSTFTVRLPLQLPRQPQVRGRPLRRADRPVEGPARRAPHADLAPIALVLQEIATNAPLRVRRASPGDGPANSDVRPSETPRRAPPHGTRGTATPRVMSAARHRDAALALSGSRKSEVVDIPGERAIG